MADKLKEYNRKRDFEKTGEPRGTERKSSAKRARFAVQYHEATRDHYDFRLEYGGVLLSWAVPKGPSFNPSDKRLAIHVEDHPTDYATFEGTIPKGQYGGGTVMLWDVGTYAPVYDFDEGLQKGALKFELFGKRLRGIWNLVKSKRADEKQDIWFLIKHGDEYAMTETGICAYVTGVASGRTADEIAEGAPPRKSSKKVADSRKTSEKVNPFDSVSFQLAEPSDVIPEGGDWLFEVKYDGMRAAAYLDSGRARLVSRNGNDVTSRFRAVAREVERINAQSAVIDGELVVSDEQGRTSFQALQRCLRSGAGAVGYMAFDLLALNGEDLRGLPLVRRKELLDGLSDGGTVRASGYVIGRGKESFAAVEKLGMEGIVAKRVQSVYGERGAWLKIKCVKRQEFVVGGFAANDGRDMSSLLLGYYGSGGLTYCGRVGTGFTERDRAEIAKDLRRLQTQDCPFSFDPPLKRGETVIWTKPKTVAEVAFAEFTSEGTLRHASFQGFRTDKNAREVVREDTQKTGTSDVKKKSKNADRENAAFAADIAVAPNKGADASATVCGIKLSHPEREAGDSGVSKLEAARYYERVWERMKPYVTGRIMSVVRCHGDKPCFFKKHPTDSNGKGIVTVDVGGEDYFYIDSLSGLIGEVQAGTVEFHAWGSRALDFDRPDVMVFDLDPDEGMELDRVRQGALDLKSVLDELALTSFLKTSGGKGYHIVLPFEPLTGWAEFKDFARTVAEVMAARWPGRYTANSRKAARTGKIYIDWMRNGKGATSVSPYSLRAKTGGVSMPVDWRELHSVTPNGIDISGAAARLGRPDPWQDYFKVRQSLVLGRKK